MQPLNFAIFVGGDAYSTDKKIMGRQSAGEAMIRGVARKWRQGTVHAFGAHRSAGQALADQLAKNGFEGSVRWRGVQGDEALDALGAVYYPAPVPARLAHGRNLRSPTAYSLFGVTHTLSSEGAMDQVAAMVMPPFKPWDALICTSQAAREVVTRLQTELKEWYREHTGATRFNEPELAVIPLGVDAPAFTRGDEQRANARRQLGLDESEVAFLFAGRLTFHAKANPSALYQALEQAAKATAVPLVCIEAGVFSNSATERAFEQAKRMLAPSVRFVGVDGSDLAAYRQAWQAADVFASLSDNIQETFGLTPVEAMAAGMPVLVSDWNGYKDTVRDGIEGFRIPVTLPETGVGVRLAERHAYQVDTYDYFIGRTSMATVIDIEALAQRIEQLATSHELRESMGRAGRSRVEQIFDWPMVLDRYAQLAHGLGEMRRSHAGARRESWPLRPDPFDLFAGYPTRTLTSDWKVTSHSTPEMADRFLDLEVAKYAFVDSVLTADMVRQLHREIAFEAEMTVAGVALASQLGPDRAALALMWLAKFNLVRIHP